MGSARVPTSALACLGMLAGLLLLGFAGVIAVYAPIASVAKEVQGAGQAEPRRLQVTFGVAQVPPTTTWGTSWDSWDASSSSDFSSEPSKSSDWSSNGFSGPGSNTASVQWVNLFSTWGFGWNGFLIAMLLFACIYMERVVDPIISLKGTMSDINHQGQRNYIFTNHADDFYYNICECMADQWTCVHGLCCPLVRMAHTNAVAGILGFWETACFYCIAESCCLGRCLMVYWRMRLKEIMNIEDHCVNDFLVTFCCPGLSICQQASSVDHEFKYEVVGCCDLDWYDTELNMATDHYETEKDMLS